MMGAPSLVETWRDSFGSLMRNAALVRVALAVALVWNSRGDRPVFRVSHDLFLRGRCGVVAHVFCEHDHRSRSPEVLRPEEGSLLEQPLDSWDGFWAHRLVPG